MSLFIIDLFNEIVSFLVPIKLPTIFYLPKLNLVKRIIIILKKWAELSTEINYNSKKIREYALTGVNIE